MSGGGATGPWPDRPGPPVPPHAWPPPPPAGPPPAASPRRPDSSAPGLVIGALVLLGALLSFLALQSADNAASSGAVAASPLRFLAVESLAVGECAAPSATSLTAPDLSACLTLDTGHGIEVERLGNARIAGDLTTGAGWAVDITLLAEDALRFGDLTEYAAGQPPPRNQVAIVLGGRLLTAPVVASRIDGGEVRISGDLTRADAEQLAAELRS